MPRVHCQQKLYYRGFQAIIAFLLGLAVPFLPSVPASLLSLCLPSLFYSFSFESFSRSLPRALLPIRSEA